MDSLLANYASSDEEDQQPKQLFNYSTDKNNSSTKPNSSSSPFISLPPPKSHQNNNNDITTNYTSSSSILFSFLPQPKSQTSNNTPHQEIQITKQPSNPKPKKRVIQFKPPPLINPYSKNYEDEDDKEEEEKALKERRRNIVSSSAETPSVKSFLSSIPAPKNSKAALGALPSSASGRRSIVVDTETPSEATENKVEIHNNYYNTNNDGITTYNYDNNNNVSVSESYSMVESSSDNVNYYQGSEGYVNYGSIYGGSYEQQQYEGNWGSCSMATGEQEMPVMSESAVRVLGKRKKNEMPMEIVEVKQDELMKNRPREDQSKLTGIAFGPSYQPVSSGKGKPSKLHKRKHQIGTLFYDMKQKEMELSERRAKGFLTKAETQAKYGW